MLEGGGKVVVSIKSKRDKMQWKQISTFHCGLDLFIFCGFLLLWLPEFCATYCLPRRVKRCLTATNGNPHKCFLSLNS